MGPPSRATREPRACRLGRGDSEERGTPRGQRDAPPRASRSWLPSRRGGGEQRELRREPSPPAAFRVSAVRPPPVPARKRFSGERARACAAGDQKPCTTSRSDSSALERISWSTSHVRILSRWSPWSWMMSPYSCADDGGEGEWARGRAGRQAEQMERGGARTLSTRARGFT